MLWSTSAEDAVLSPPRFRPLAWIGLCVSTLAQLCRPLPRPWFLGVSAIFTGGVLLGHGGYLETMSKKKWLSLPENLWLGPPPPQGLSFVSFSSVLPTGISSFNSTERLGEVWVGMDCAGWGEAMRRFSTTDSDAPQAPQGNWVGWP